MLVEVLFVSLAVLAGLVVLAVVAVRRVVGRVRRSVGTWLGRRAPWSLTPVTAGGPRLGSEAPLLGLVARGAAPVSSARTRVLASVPGPHRQVATMRRELRQDLRGAERAVAAGRADDRPVAGIESVLKRLAEQADHLDVDLAVISNEPDRGVRGQLLGAQQDRLTLVHRTCSEIRRAVLLAGNIATASLLRSVENDLNDEVITLAFQARAYAELHGPSTFT